MAKVQQQIDPRVWPVVANDLLETPGVRQITFVLQTVVAPPLMDAVGMAIQNTGSIKEDRQVFLASDIKTNKPFLVHNHVGVPHFEIEGTIPETDWIYAPGAFYRQLVELRDGKPLSIAVSWVKYNLKTHQYIAITTSAPLIHITEPAEKLN